MYNHWGFADVYIHAFSDRGLVVFGLPIIIGIVVAVPLAEMARGGVFRSMLCRVDRRRYLISAVSNSALSGFVVAFSTMITISLFVWAMTSWGSGFHFSEGAIRVEGYHSPRAERTAWNSIGGFPALFAQVSPGFSYFAMSVWAGLSGALFGIFASTLALVSPLPRLAFLGPILWLQLTMLATRSIYTSFGWVGPLDALYPWMLTILMIPGRIAGLAIYSFPILICLWLVFRRTERIASMQ